MLKEELGLQSPEDYRKETKGERETSSWSLLTHSKRQNEMDMVEGGKEELEELSVM